MTHGMHVVNCHKVISGHHTLDLKVILPSIERDIDTNLQTGRIKAFKQNWALLTQDPWVLQTVQGFHLPLVAQPVQTTVPSQMHFPPTRADNRIRCLLSGLGGNSEGPEIDNRGIVVSERAG